MTLTELDGYTRDLTGIKATNVVTTTLMARFINEAYSELHRLEGWSWIRTTLTAGDSPSFSSEWHHILAYRAAVKVLNFTSDNTNRADGYKVEYGAILSAMKHYYLTGSATGDVSTTTKMVLAVRGVADLWDKLLMPDALLIQYINSAFQELQLQRNWSWMKQTVTLPLGAALDDVHTINTELDRNTVYHISQVSVVDTSGNFVQTAHASANVGSIHRGMGRVFYDIVDTPSEDNPPVPLITIKVAPEQTSTHSLLVEFTAVTDISTGSDTTPIGPYNMLMVYRAAIRALAQAAVDERRTKSVDEARVKAFSEEYSLLLRGLVKQYALVNDGNSFQLGANGTWAR